MFYLLNSSLVFCCYGHFSGHFYYHSYMEPGRTIVHFISNMREEINVTEHSSRNFFVLSHSNGLKCIIIYNIFT